MGKPLCRMIGCGVVLLAAGYTAWTGEPLPPRFHFPPLEPDNSLSVKAEGILGLRPARWQARMVVDGTLTDGHWPEHPPATYRIGKRTYLLDDYYSGAGDFVWDGESRTLTPVGRCYLHQVPGVGTVVIRRPDGERRSAEVLDFPDENGQPRVLWRGDEPSIAPLGVWDRAVVFVLGEKRLLVLEPASPPREIDMDLGKFHWQKTGDAIRRGKALVLGELPSRRAGQEGPYTVQVAVVNLKTREIKPIGSIPGSWSITNVPHPVAAASCISQEQAGKLPKPEPLPFGANLLGRSYVIEETDQIVK